jgi:hypothetical protein
MTERSTPAERLDRAIDALLAGSPPPAAAAVGGVSAADRSLVRAAATVRAALGTSLAGPRFEARLGARLAGTAAGTPPWILRHPGRLIVTGAVGSVGVGVTAYAVWRSRSGHRPVHR